VERLLAKSLGLFDRDRFTHRVCCVSTGGFYEEELRSLGIPYYILKRRFRLDPSVIYQMAKLMRSEHIDLVHTLAFTANTWGRVAAKLARVPYIIAHERGTAWTENAIMRCVDRVLYRFTDLILTNSEAAKIVLTEHVGLQSERIRTVYNGLPQPEVTGRDLTLRLSLGIGPQEPVVMNVGRLDTPKGHIHLLDAIPFVWQSVPETHFVLIGDGPLRGYLKNELYRRDLEKSGRVHMLGFLPEAPELMQEADVLVHPAIREPFGNVLVEAGMASLPVVASSVDGCSEVIVDGRTGVLINCTVPVKFVPAPGASPVPKVVVDGVTRNLRPPLGPSPEAIAEAVVTLLRNSRLRLEMGRKAHERVTRLFSLSRYVRDLESAYRSVL
jgi:glycosyltransferase involved in cell wall biosynthesis